MNSKKVLFGGVVGIMALAPSIVFAQYEGLTTIHGLLRVFGDIVNIAIPIAFSLGVLGFFWGLAMYIFSAGNEEKKKEGKNIMIWGIIALFVMVSIFGIIRVLQGTFGISRGENSITPPSINR